MCDVAIAVSNGKGEKVYGYLKSDVKKTVDEIFEKFAGNESIKKMYNFLLLGKQNTKKLYDTLVKK